MPSAVAPGIEFDDVKNVKESLEGLRPVADFEYAVVHRQNGTVMAGVNIERMPSGRSEPGGTVTVQVYRAGPWAGD